jgi:hypothetical protein
MPGACQTQVFDIQTADHSAIVAEAIERIAAVFAIERGTLQASGGGREFRQARARLCIN